MEDIYFRSIYKAVVNNLSVVPINHLLRNLYWFVELRAVVEMYMQVPACNNNKAILVSPFDLCLTYSYIQ